MIPRPSKLSLLDCEDCVFGTSDTFPSVKYIYPLFAIVGNPLLTEKGMFMRILPKHLVFIDHFQELKNFLFTPRSC